MSIYDNWEDTAEHVHNELFNYDLVHRPEDQS